MSLWASRCLVLSWVFGLAACATAKLDTTRSITVKSGWFADGYEQDGQTLDRGDLADKLALHPVAGPKMDGYKTTWWLGNVLGIVGWGIVSYDMGVNHIIGATNDPLHEPSYTLTFVGLGIAIAALPFMFVTNHKLGTAVHAYNSSLATPLRPMVSPASPAPLALAIKPPVATPVEAETGAQPAGWVNYRELEVIDFLRNQNRLLREPRRRGLIGDSLRRAR